MELKQLKEERGAIVRSLNDLADLVDKEQRSFTDDELKRFDELSATEKELQGKIETQERVLRSKSLVKPEFSAPAVISRSYDKPSQGEQNLAFRAWGLQASGNGRYVSDAMKRAAERCGVDLYSGAFILRAQTIGTDAEGGYTKSGSVYQGIVNSLKDFGGMRSVANVLRTSNGNTVHFATNDDTANVGAIIGENSNVSNTSMTFGTVPIVTYKYASAAYKVSVELLQDSEENLSGFIGGALGTRIARVQNTHWTTGDGSSKPYGFLSETTEALDAAAVAAVTIDELIDCYHSVDAAYRNSAKWMMNDSSVAKLRKLKDSNGLPLLQESYRNDGFALLGKEVVVNNDMPAMAAGNKAIAFGDFSAYCIRDVNDIEVRVLNELYALDGSVAFVAFARSGGRLLNTKAVKHITMAAA